MLYLESFFVRRRHHHPPARSSLSDVTIELKEILNGVGVSPGNAQHEFAWSTYTLLKAFLSSHKALAKTAENRPKNATDKSERQALTTLKQLAEEITDDDSARLTAFGTGEPEQIVTGADRDRNPDRLRQGS